jgi:hypothetical protein
MGFVFHSPSIIYVIKTFLTAPWNRCGNIIVLCSFLMIFAKMAMVIYLMIWHFIYNNIFFLSFWILSRIDSLNYFSAQLPFGFYNSWFSGSTQIHYLWCHYMLYSSYNCSLQYCKKKKTIMNRIVIKVLSVKMVHLKFHMFW